MNILEPSRSAASLLGPQTLQAAPVTVCEIYFVFCAHGLVACKHAESPACQQSKGTCLAMTLPSTHCFRDQQELAGA